jgi:hypothetical protein
MLDRLFRRDRGQGLVEYALIIALVAVVVIGILILLGPGHWQHLLEHQSRALRPERTPDEQGSSPPIHPWWGVAMRGAASSFIA